MNLLFSYEQIGPIHYGCLSSIFKIILNNTFVRQSALKYMKVQLYMNLQSIYLVTEKLLENILYK